MSDPTSYIVDDGSGKPPYENVLVTKDKPLPTTDAAAIAHLATLVGTVIDHQNGTAIKVSTGAAKEDGFRGYGEANGVSGDNIDVLVGPTSVQPEPVPAGFDLWIESSSTADNGITTTGVLTVDIHYVDTTGVELEVSVTLNGSTPVNTGITDCMFVNAHHATSIGSGLVAAGNIDCTQGTGGTVVSRILAAGNWSLSAMKMVPAGKRLCLTGWHCSSGVSAGGKLATLRLRTSSDELGTLFTGVYMFKDTVMLRDESSGYIVIDPLSIVPALATVKISTWTTGTVNVAGRWSGWLENV